MCFHPHIRHIASCNSLKRFSLGFCPKLVPVFSKHLSKHNCYHQCCLPLEKSFDAQWLWESASHCTNNMSAVSSCCSQGTTRLNKAARLCWAPTAWGLLSQLPSEAPWGSRGELSNWAVGVIQAGCVSARTEAENVLAQSQARLTETQCHFTFSLCRCPGFWWNSVGEQGCSYWDGERPACSEQRAKGSK